MATLLIIWGPKRVRGRCDARCYDAQHPACSCVCGGGNHGIGLEAAIENTKRHGKRYLEEYVDEQEVDPAEVGLYGCHLVGYPIGI